MKYEIGQLIYFLRNNRVHSAKVLARNLVENADNAPDTIEKAKLFTPWGVSGIWYATCHGQVNENDAFASKEELAASLLVQ